MYINFFLYLYICKDKIVLNSLPLVRKVPKRVRILVFRIGKVIGGLVLSKVALELGYVLMDDLTRAVAQFYYPPSGGINEGWFSQPPTPTPPPENSGVGLIPGAQSEGESPDPNHYASGSSQAGKNQLFSVLERHLRRYCASQAVAHKFPYLKDRKQEDFDYFAQHFSITELDIESKTEVEIAELSTYIKKNYNRVKTLFSFFFESYFKKDD